MVWAREEGAEAEDVDTDDVGVEDVGAEGADGGELFAPLHRPAG